MGVGHNNEIRSINNLHVEGALKIDTFVWIKHAYDDCQWYEKLAVSRWKKFTIFLFLSFYCQIYVNLQLQETEPDLDKAVLTLVILLEFAVFC